MVEVMIPHTAIKRNGKVDLWDLDAENGPIRIELFPIDAKHALKFRDRYVFKLPKGKTPGPAQIEAEERAAAESDDQTSRDPHFGANP